MKNPKVATNDPPVPASAIHCRYPKAFCFVCVLVCLMLAQGAHGQNSLTNGLVSYWTFDNPANLGQDSVGPNSGVVTGGAYPFGGRVGPGALYCDGTDGYLTVADNPDLEFSATDSYSLAAWAYPATLPAAWSCVVSKSRSQAPWYGIWIDPNNKWVYGQPINMEGPALPVDAGGALVPQWHHIVILQDGLAGTNSLYVDGSVTNSGAAADGNGTGALTMGADSAGEFFKGVIDDVRLYNRPLSEAEIAQLYNAPVSSTTLPLALLIQPQDASIFNGQQVTLSAQVNAAGYTSLWYKNKSPVGAAASATAGNAVLGTGALSYPADNGAQYYVVFSGAAGSITSRLATITVSSSAVGIDSDLVGHWTFDDPANLGADSASTNNAVAFGGAYPFVGRIGPGALYVDGVDGYLQVANNPAFDFTAAQSFTLAAWAYPTALPGTWAGVVTVSRNPSPWYGIWINPANQWLFGVTVNNNEFGPGLPVDASGALVGGWHHVAVMQDGVAGTTSLYVDGAVVNTGLATACNGTGPLWMGGSYGESEFFNGAIDDVRLYNRTLSATEIAELYNAPVSSNSAPLALLIQPQDASLFVGEQAVLTAMVNSIGYTSQWYRDNTPVGAPGSALAGEVVLETGALSYPADNGAKYHVVFSSAAGSITSRVATITVGTVTNIDSGLVAHWTFDDPANLGADSASTNNAVVVGGAYSFGGARIGPGAVFVDGVDGYLEAADNPALRFVAAQSFTLAAWAYPVTLPGAWTCIVSKSRSVAPWYGIWIDPANNWDFGQPLNLEGTGLPVDASGALVPQWHHIAVLQDGVAGTSALYVDGAAVNTGGAADVNGAGALWMGADSVGEFFNGAIDDVRLYKRALSDAEIAQLYNAPVPSTTLPLAVVQQPADVATITGQPVTLTALANNFGLTFQWYKGTAPIGASAPAPVTGGGANASFTTAPLTVADNGSTYYVVFTGSSGSVTSRVAQVTVKEPVDGLIAYYTFDNPANLGADSSAVGLNPGTPVGGASFSASSRVGSGALAVDGLSGHIVVPDVPYMRFGATNSYSVTVWFQAQPNNNWGGIVDKSRDIGAWWGIWRDPAGPNLFTGSAETWPPTESVLSDGVWHHAAIVQNGSAGTYLVYLDGVDLKVPFNSPLPNTGTGDLWIGGANDGNGAYEYFNGLIDDVRIYNLALSASDVSALANAPLRPTIGLSRGPGGPTITFTGTLQAAGSLSGTWTNVTGAVSPLVITNPKGSAFYRTQQ
jgi:hypothetical protein